MSARAAMASRAGGCECRSVPGLLDAGEAPPSCSVPAATAGCSPRPGTVGAAPVLLVAGGVPGFPVRRLAAATTVTGLALAHARRRRGGAVRPLRAAAALAAAALVCLTACLALAKTT